MDKQIKEYVLGGKKNLIIVYMLYLCGVAAPILPIIGVVFVYINKDTTDKFTSSHYIFLFRSFCLGLLGYIISFIATFIIIGIALHFALAIWFILRIALGFKYLLEDKAHPNPMTYWIK